MISEEERKAIKMCRLLLNGDITLHVLDDDGGTAYAGTVNKEYNKDLETVLNLVEKQEKEIEYWKEQAEGYGGLAKQVKENYEQILEDYYNEG